MLRPARGDHAPDEREDVERDEEAGGADRRLLVPRRADPDAEQDEDVTGEMERDREPREAPGEPRRAAAHDRSCAGSQSETCAGCIVSATTLAQVGREPVELDLLAQPRPERLERALGVVAAPVEAPVDEPLHPGAHRQEERGDDERRDRDREVRAAGERREHRLPCQHEPGVGSAEDHRQRAVDERARDHAVDLVEPVAQHRHADRDRDRQDSEAA